MFSDQDIFAFVNPQDLHHIYKDEISQPVIPDISWNLVVNRHDQSTREKRSKSLPLISRTEEFPTFPVQQQQPSPQPRRICNSYPEKINTTNSARQCKGLSLSDSSLEDNGMEFFDEESHDSSYELDGYTEADEEEDSADIIAEEEEEVQQSQKNFKLQSSKSPVIDALVYCALMKIGLTLIEDSSSLVQFRIHDFPLYYNKSAGICSKANPTDDVYSRVKALQRWFPDFPTLKEIGKGMPCIISLSRDRNYKNFEKLQVILEKQKLLLKGAKNTKVRRNTK